VSLSWSALHAQLVRNVNRHSSTPKFIALFLTEDPFTAFRDPTHLFGWLHDRSRDPAAKNDVLVNLLRAAGGNDSAGDLAVELLLLALWPGLCVIRYRLRPLCRNFTLDADLLGGLSACIRDARPGRINWVAATLLRNLERDLRREYIRDDGWSQASVDLDLVGHTLSGPEVECPEAILAAAHAAQGMDGLLLAAVHVAGFTQKEAAERLGLSHEVARKRCQRALARLTRKIDG